MEVTSSRLPMIHKDSKLIMWGMKNLITLTDIADLARIRIFVQDYHPLFRKAWLYEAHHKKFEVMAKQLGTMERQAKGAEEMLIFKGHPG
ncbi:hypothetical protein FCV25MIE_09388 [Fagus crenata]